MNEKPLVSICIPTYNRVEYLKASIDSIVGQEDFLNGNVEIAVSDNASTDGTEEICRVYSEKFNNFKYFKNDVNVSDRNFPLSLSRGTGLLRKLSNDTLIYSQNSLSIICRIVLKHKGKKPVIFFMNNRNKLFSFFKNKFVKDRLLERNRFLKKLSYYITWIGGFSIWEDDCHYLDKDEGDCDKKLWQVGKLYDLINNHGIGLINNKCLFSVQEVKGKDVSYGIFNVFYRNYLDILDRQMETKVISKLDYSYLKKDLLFNFFSFWIAQWDLNKKKSSSSEEDLKKLVFNEYKKEKYFGSFLVYYGFKKMLIAVYKLMVH